MCNYSFAGRKHIPFNAVCCREHVAIVNQHPTAVEPIEVAQPCHPGELVDPRGLSADDSRSIVTFSAACKHKIIKQHKIDVNFQQDADSIGAALITQQNQSNMLYITQVVRGNG